MSPRCCGHNYMLSNTRIYNNKIRMKTDLTSGLLINSNDGLITTDLFIMELNPKILKFSLIPDSVICFQTPEVSF